LRTALPGPAVPIVDTTNMVLRIFLRVIAQSLQSNSPGAAQVDKAALHIGAVAFIHRFGSSLNEHVHFHVCVVDGVFEQVPGEGEVGADADVQDAATPAGVIFHPATGLDADAVDQVQATLRRRVLRGFIARGLLEKADAKEMLAYQHSGFSVDTGVCIGAHDRAGLERLLRYCARPPFAMERLRKEGAELVYRCAKQRSEPGMRCRWAAHAHPRPTLPSWCRCRCRPSVLVDVNYPDRSATTILAGGSGE
jgi:hypothetical protein